jgi:hypothetical protein
VKTVHKALDTICGGATARNSPLIVGDSRSVTSPYSFTVRRSLFTVWRAQSEFAVRWCRRREIRCGIHVACLPHDPKTEDEVTNSAPKLFG